MFSISNIVGPILGGVFTQHVSYVPGPTIILRELTTFLADGDGASTVRYNLLVKHTAIFSDLTLLSKSEIPPC